MIKRICHVYFTGALSSYLPAWCPVASGVRSDIGVPWSSSVGVRAEPGVAGCARGRGLCKNVPQCWAWIFRRRRSKAT